ncbi:MAG TPA: hypothetical protein VL225_20120 [Vicinamibacterales bacterium]|jgi:hypothetical protein|nr:hypothetical protein [Vicinamibacterales bacterium]
MVRTGLGNIRRQGAAAAAIAGLGALIAGCSAIARPESIASVGGTHDGGVAVACEPNQRAVVRQLVVNGASQPQVECVSVAGFAPGPAVATYGAPSAAGYQTIGYTQAPLENTRLVRTVYPEREVTTRAVAPRRVNYQRAPERIVAVRPARSVKKSAIIIGSSAGVGAGIGAAAGGKKGALIGALIGGGGATLWDQITRHKQ